MYQYYILHSILYCSTSLILEREHKLITCHLRAFVGGLFFAHLHVSIKVLVISLGMML